MCVNFHELNRLAIKKRYPLPLISRLLDQINVQGVYQDWFTWGIQLGAYSRRWRMEDFISYMLWPFWVCCDALSPYKCAYRLSTLHEWRFSSIPKWLWSITLTTSSFLQKLGRAWMTCSTYFGQTQGSWTLHQTKEMWISSNWSGIPWLHHLWKWHLHGFLQGLDHCQLGYPSFYLWCSMFSWICQLLSAFHCAIFYDNGSSYSFNLKRSTFFMGSWS